MTSTFNSGKGTQARGVQLPAVLCLLTLSGCWSSEPFAYVKVHGKVSYDDGSLIPADPLVLTFYPQDKAPKGKDYPRPGMATVDKATGKFDSITSHMVGDGLVRGKHKVTLSSPGNIVLTPSLMPSEYGDMNRTPLEVDTANSPFELKVRKPR
jgi:hypothetical protein